MIMGWCFCDVRCEDIELSDEQNFTHVFTRKDSIPSYTGSENLVCQSWKVCSNIYTTSQTMMWCDQSHVRRCRRNQKKAKKNFLLLPETSSCSRIPSRSIVWWRLHCAKLAARLLTKGSRQCRLIPFLLLPPSIEPSSSFIHDSHREPNTTRSERKKRRKPEQTLLYVNVDISYPWRLEHSAENIQHATLAFTPQVSKLSARCSRVSQWSTVEQSKPSCSHSVPRISFIFFVEWETLFFRFVFLVSYSYCEHFYGHELKLL